MTATKSIVNGGEESNEQAATTTDETIADILSSRTVAVAEELHSTALNAESTDEIVEAIEEAATEIEALKQLSERGAGSS